MQQDKNPPNYIKQLPWYAQDSEGRGELIKIPVYQVKGRLDQWFVRGQKGHQASSYRKGACPNCGAMGHTRKDCTERPRKLTAQYSNRQIAADDVYAENKVSWQVKQDRWDGYQPEMYKQVIEQFNEFEEVKKKIKGEQDLIKRDNALQAAQLPTSKKQEKFQGLTENRNREDKAKYLLNLSESAPNFNPKSRTLQGEDDYLKELHNLDAVGEKASLQQQERFAFEQVEKHNAQLSSTALPTLTEKIFKNVQEKKAGLNSGKMGELTKKYGRNEGMVLDVVEEEEEVDLASRRKRVIRSKYQEDVFVNDHSAVWGSWYNPTLGWGYACCYNTQKLSFCAGIKGRQRALAKELRVLTQRAKEQQKIKQLQQVAESEAVDAQEEEGGKPE